MPRARRRWRAAVSMSVLLVEEGDELGPDVVQDLGLARRLRVLAVGLQELPVLGDAVQEEGQEGELVASRQLHVSAAEFPGVSRAVVGRHQYPQEQHFRSRLP